MIGAVLGAYLGSYLVEKAKNRATRQDIEALTRLVEEIKFALQARHTLRFAALDRRLQAHQEAYGLSRKLVGAVQTKSEVERVFSEIGDWFNANALYLEPEARDALWEAYLAAYVHPSKEREQDCDGENARENWEKIVVAQEKIAAAVGLPPLKDSSPARDV